MKGDKIKYRSGYKYQLAETYVVQTNVKPTYSIETDYINLTTDGLLTIKKGYAWDGPSGPCPDFKRVMRGSLIHDALYQLMREKWLDSSWRDEADTELKHACIEDDFPRWLTSWVYHAVDNFAAFASKPKNRKKILVAP